MTQANESAVVNMYGRGLTKLEYFAAKAMQGILTNAALVEMIDKQIASIPGAKVHDGIAVFARQCAVSLVAELNK